MIFIVFIEKMAAVMEFILSILLLSATVRSEEPAWYISGVNVGPGNPVDRDLTSHPHSVPCANMTWWQFSNTVEYYWDANLREREPYFISGIKIHRNNNTARERLYGLIIKTYFKRWKTVFADNETHLSRCTEYHERKDKPLVCKDIIDVALDPPVQATLVRLKLKSYVTICAVEIIAVACTQPHVPNGSTNATAKSFTGTHIHLHCVSGYISSTPTSVCTSQGTWHPKPGCAKGCMVPDPFPNGKYINSISEALVSGTAVPVNFEIIGTCLPGYSSINNNGNTKRICADHQVWNGPELTCISRNCRYPSLPHGFYHNQKVPFYGSKPLGSAVIPHCDDVYYLREHGSRNCLVNETRSVNDPECIPIICHQRPQSHRNGFFLPIQQQLIQHQFQYGFTFVPQCNTGFKLVHGSNRTCSEFNVWKGGTDRCDRVLCAVTALVNGFYTYVQQRYFNKTIEYDLFISPRCNKGYHLSNSDDRKCQENGELSGVNPLCEIDRCNSFGPLSNGTLRYQNSTLTLNQALDYNTSVFSVCNKGFELHGSAERKCLENGSWSGISPICEKIRCKIQTIIKDLYQQNRKEIFFGDKFAAVYNSDHFHLVNGSLYMICEHDGSLRWATQQPFLASICKVQKNGHFRANTRDCMVDDKCEVGETITFECREDYQMVQISATCLPNHTWSSEPICTPLSKPTSSGVIIGGAVAVGVAVIAIVIAVLLFLNRRKLRNSETKTRYEKADEPKDELNVYSEISETHKTDRKKVEDTAECAYVFNTIAVGKDEYAANPSDQSYYSFESSYNMPVTAIKVEDLYDVVLGSEHGVTMKKQFQDFPKGLKDDYSAALQVQNKPKNRYKHINPYNDTRVILPTDERHSDYINASFINGYNKTCAFIASQGPTDEMLVDFWRMAWHVGCGKIVMLTNLEEDKKMKCVQYWPDEGCKEYEDFLITNRGTEYFSDFIIRKLSIQKTHGEERKFIHFHFTAWPDKSVPKYSSSLVHFRHKVETTIVNENGPVIVHCSAGVGRTGTFIALNVLSEQAATLGYVDPVGCVSTLRKQRVDMVQTEDQYVFLHMALLETLMLSTSALPASKFMGAYEKLLASDKTQRTREIDVEFSRMKKMSPVADECQYVSAKELRNRNKNRYSNILPVADHMPYLTPSGKRSDPDYINAVFLPGYKRKGAFIVTQTPLEATKTDFWRLVVEHDVHTIVMMNNKSEMKEDEIYWPENEDSETYENMMITKTGQAREKGLRKITFDLKRFGQTRKLQQIQFESWPDDSALPSSPKDVLSLLDSVQFWQHQSGNNPVLVHCMNGADRSGLFCVASTVLERMKIEQDVAITQVIKEMRNYREQIIPSVDQFQFVHEVVKEYILQNETYSNFTY
ncbi:uncharacterized protein LOC128214498 isoform X2 [Mya arenaria]|uniref:uncharacterized protein LOC128214498 isoform X2 n=1 Tax=Mya arenaria TaxID=6604 RepID=UPI0022DED4EC|nr:uncharacterized protein LOC128214498 isoform X2 [Mya arenaria]